MTATSGLPETITYYNSFLPIIEGRVEISAPGSRLTATLRLHRFVAVFAVLWLGFLTLFTALVVTAVVTGGTSAWVFLALLPFAGFAHLLVTSFRSEARRARVLLEAVAAGGTLLAPAEDWFESANNLDWRDIRRAGWLGYVALLSYPVTAGLGLYTWLSRPGCSASRYVGDAGRCSRSRSPTTSPRSRCSCGSQATPRSTRTTADGQAGREKTQARARAATSCAVSVGVVPTWMPRASSASFFPCAVPDEPEMIAPACPIVLPGGAVNPAM